MILLRALAAFAGHLDRAALRKLIDASHDLDITLPSLSDILETSLWSDAGIAALQPDLLAAELLHYVLTQLTGDQAGQWQYLGLDSAADIAQASSVLGRLIHDAQSMLGRDWPWQA